LASGVIKNLNYEQDNRDQFASFKPQEDDSPENAE